MVLQMHDVLTALSSKASQRGVTVAAMAPSQLRKGLVASGSAVPAGERERALGSLLVAAHGADSCGRDGRRREQCGGAEDERSSGEHLDERCWGVGWQTTDRSDGTEEGKNRKAITRNEG
jgi:hypothetical protein